MLAQLSLRNFGFLAMGFIATISGCSREKTERIPLDLVYSTNQQGELQEVPWIDDLTKLTTDSQNGASNTFLVEGKDIRGAIKATREVVFGFGRADELALTMRDENRKIWMVVFFGFHASNPIRWRIDSVHESPTRVRINYSLPERPFAQTLDMHPYYVWVPLRNLKEGKLALEIADVQTGEIVLMRQVTVRESKNSRQ
ncbi:MAG: hypothetical protein L0Y72_09350 [Gemmataceae bacterium]|nr:hypothetical protein [Gemmataceae bacterium]MCI0739238.1 hypothetical protein [Gemmataceae bacterium]